MATQRYTVSFARASLGDPLASAQTVMSETGSAKAPARAVFNRVKLVLGAVVLLGTGIGIGIGWWWVHSSARPRVVFASVSVPSSLPRLPAIHLPLVPSWSRDAVGERAADGERISGKPVSARPRKHRVAQARPPRPTTASANVQEKFRAVKAEYDLFKGEYGSVLEEKWNAIANEIAFGKADKFDKVDAMLDALTREMATVRAGEE
jgi:hypothetical protein